MELGVECPLRRPRPPPCVDNVAYVMLGAVLCAVPCCVLCHRAGMMMSPPSLTSHNTHCPDTPPPGPNPLCALCCAVPCCAVSYCAGMMMSSPFLTPSPSTIMSRATCSTYACSSQVSRSAESDVRKRGKMGGAADSIYKQGGKTTPTVLCCILEHH